MWSNRKPYLFVLPALIVMGFLFVGGLLEGLVQSLGFFPAAGQFDWSVSSYHQLLGDADFWYSLWVTFRTALLSTLSAGVLGMLVAVGLFLIEKTGKSKGSRLFARLFQIPLALPHFVGAYLMVLLLMQSGWLSRLLYGLGWIDNLSQFPVLIQEPFGWGIIFTYTWKEAPFIALMIYPVLQRIHTAWLEAARMLGANYRQFTFNILLPLLVPAWGAASFIVFAFTFSAFEVPFLLGVTYPEMLPVFSYRLYAGGELAQRPLALAMNVMLALITALLGMLAYRWSKRWQSKSERGWS